MKKQYKYILVFLLILGLIAILGSVITRYHISPIETYAIDKENHVADGSFEKFSQKVSDCCTTTQDSDKAKIAAGKFQDAIDGNFSLDLTSSNHCACISKQILNFSNKNKYLLSIYYKGDNPRICNWVVGENMCMPEERISSTKKWTNFKTILSFSENSKSSEIFLYADSSGEEITNFYDNLEVHALVPIPFKSNLFFPEEKYIILTRKENNIKNAELLKNIDEANGEIIFAYYTVVGKPEITMKFPILEIVVIVLIFLVIIRVVFKKQANEPESELEHMIKEVSYSTKDAVEEFVDETKKATALIKAGELIEEAVEAVEKEAVQVEKKIEDKFLPSQPQPKQDSYPRKYTYTEAYKRNFEKRFGKKYGS